MFSFSHRNLLTFDAKCLVKRRNDHSMYCLNITLFCTPINPAQALIEMGEAMKQMADVKYSLDDNIKQNFLEPLHHLQTKDLKEVMVRLLEKLCTLSREITAFRAFGSDAKYVRSSLICCSSTTGRNCKAVGWTLIASEDVRRKVR